MEKKKIYCGLRIAVAMKKNWKKFKKRHGYSSFLQYQTN